jgi:hypothetical protein
MAEDETSTPDTQKTEAASEGEAAPAEKAPAPDKPAAPVAPQLDVNSLVDQIGTAVMGKLDVEASVQKALASKFAPTDAAPAPNVLKQYFEEDTAGFVKEIVEHTKEQVKVENHAAAKVSQARQKVLAEYQLKVPDIGRYPAEIRHEIEKVQNEYYNEHGQHCTAEIALPHALKRTTKRLGLEERTEDEIARAAVPGGAGGGYNPQGQRGTETMSSEDYISNLKEQAKKHRVRQV